MRCAVRKVPFNGLSDVQLRELLACRRKLPIRSTSNQFLLQGLRFTPVASAKRLPESLPINKEVRMPCLTALYECHAVCLSPHLPLYSCAFAHSSICCLLRPTTFVSLSFVQNRRTPLSSISAVS